jgi:hypothetical protein
MKLSFKSAQTYRLGETVYEYQEGEADVPDEMAEIALGAGWATLVEEPKAKKPPANKAIKVAPENK